MRTRLVLLGAMLAACSSESNSVADASGSGSSGSDSLGSGSSGTADERGDATRDFLDSLGLICQVVRSCYPEEVQDPMGCRAPGAGDATAYWRDFSAVRDLVETCLASVEDRVALDEWMACIVSGTEFTADCMTSCPSTADECVLAGNELIESCDREDSVAADVDICLREGLSE